MNALILQHLPDHKQVATTNGGEWQGPCPFCGGKDRFYVQPAREDYAHRGGYAACRQCAYSNDAIDLVQQLTRCSYQEARRTLMLGQDARYSTPAAQPAQRRRSRGKKAPRRSAAPVPQRKPSGPPPEAWQRRGCKLLRSFPLAVSVHDACAYLVDRGLEKETIRRAGIRWNPSDVWEAHSAWGLEEIINPDTGNPSKVWIPRGWVIPHLAYGALWGIRVRRPNEDLAPDSKRKYQWVKGSRPTLYGAESLQTDRPAILVEGVFNMLSVRQAASDLVTPVAAGSTTYCRAAHWERLLTGPPLLLVSFDNDANRAGAKNAAYWLHRLPDAHAWFAPGTGLDVNDLLRIGGNAAIRAWIDAGLSRPRTEAELPSEDEAPKYPHALLKRADEILERWGTDVIGPLAAWYLFESNLPPAFWDGHAIDGGAGVYASTWLRERIMQAIGEVPTSPSVPYLRGSLLRLYEHVQIKHPVTP